MLKPNAENVAAVMGCTIGQAKAQFARCSADLLATASKARARGGKWRGFTAEWYEDRAAAFEEASK